MAKNKPSPPSNSQFDKLSLLKSKLTNYWWIIVDKIIQDNEKSYLDFDHVRAVEIERHTS